MDTKRNYWIFGGLVGALLLGTLVGGGYYYINSNNNPKNPNLAQTTFSQESLPKVTDKEDSLVKKPFSTLSSIISKSSSDSSDSPITKLTDILKISSSVSASSLTSSVESSSSLSTTKTGIIKGSLSYPSEGLIGVNACAQNINNGEIYCTERVSSSNQLNYQLDLPQGDYEVFSTSTILGSQRAYYDEHVICGLTVECSESNPNPKTIVIKVKSGETINSINPSNWYNSASYNNTNL